MRATFPYAVIHQDATWRLMGQSLATTQSISGVDTIVPTMRGRWMATVSYAIRGELAYLQWQEFLAQMQGRIGTTLVPCRSKYRPKDRDGLKVPFCDTAHIGGPGEMMDLSGFVNTNQTRVSMAANAPLRANIIRVVHDDTTGFRPGQYFSIRERLHKVQSTWRDGTANMVMFDPPLREAVAGGVAIEIERPVCRMRMVSEDEGMMDQSLARVPIVTVQFEEAI